jgi:hypothetical protein
VSGVCIDTGSKAARWPICSARDFGLAESHKLYDCHDLLLKHKQELFTHLAARWKDLFNAKFEVLLYDLTSTYFESDPAFGETDKRQFGYSRDKRADCVQVVIALVVTPEGFPLAYEVLAGNTSDKATLRDFLKTIEAQYGKAERLWVMDRGIPTEEVLAEMRASEPPISYLVGTPKSRLSKLEAQLAACPWEQVRPGIEVKLLPYEGELYVQAQSHDRVHKERAIRKRRLRKLWNRLCELKKMKLTAKRLLIKIGEAKKGAGRVFGLIDLKLPNPSKSKTQVNFSFRINRDKFRDAYRHEGQYLLRSNLCQQAPATLWEYYTRADPRGGSVQESERRLRHSPDFSSTSPSHRSPPLYRLCGLLSSGHAAAALARLDPRLNAARRP